MGQGTGVRSGQTHASRRIVATLAVLGALGLAVAVADSDPSAAQECAMQPQVRDHTINQGVGSYDQLAPAKETLVRLYLSMPQCAPADAEMQLTGASITVTAGATVLPPIQSSPALPSPPLTGEDTNIYPPVAQWSSAPMKDATGDPIFVIDGAALDAVLLGTVPTSISITASLEFRHRIGTGAWQSAATAAPSVGAFTGVVGVHSNPLRVLVVPMGDSSAKTEQFPSEADATVQSGMRALSRMLPLADGVEDLTSDTGGLRYRILPTLLDLGPAGLGLMDSRTPFCGKGSNFDVIQAELSKYLRSWNSQHASTPADRVVGAVWEGSSIGPATSSSCADGWGKAPGQSAWIRVTAAKTGAPSNAGALLGMELLHTWGAVSQLAPHAVGVHSVNDEADTTRPDRAYHVTERSWLAADRSVMKYATTGWHEHNTLLEPADWSHTQCALTVPQPDTNTPQCGLPGSVGSAPAGVASYFSLAGVTDGTAGGTDVHSYRSDERLGTPADDASEFRLVQRDETGALLSDEGVATSAMHSSHTGEHDHSAESGAYEIDAAVPVVDGAARFELWRGAPAASGSVLLYARDDDGQPQVGQPSTAPAAGDVVDVTFRPDRDETRPAVTDDGSWVAWVEPNGIRVRPTDGSKEASVPLPGTDPSWTGDGGALVFVRDGDLLRVSVDTSGAAATFSDEYVIYDRRLHASSDPAASRPSVGPDGRDTAVAIDGDLYVIDSSFRPSTTNPLLCPVGATLAAGPCRRVTGASATEQSPSWSAAGIFHERDGDVWVVQGDGSGNGRVTSGRMPAAEGDWLVFVRDGQLWARSDAGESVLTTDGTDAWPAITSTLELVAFDRQRSGQRDVVRLDASGRTYVVTATDDHPHDLRLDLFMGDERNPVAVGLRPVTVTGSEARFELRHRPTPGSSGTLHGRVADGWRVAWFQWAEEVLAAPAEPVPSIHTPVIGLELLQFSSIPLSGDARLAGTPLADSALRWSIVGPDGVVVHEAGGRTADVDPPVDGWLPGQYEIRLTATSDGRTATQTVPVTVQRDQDRDGIAAPRDLRSCISGADDDPTNFDDDGDGDGIPDSEDPAPCTSANNGVADFEPDTYYYPSQGLPFSVVVSSSVDLRSVPAESVAIRAVGRFPVNIPAVGWSTDKKGKTTAKFERSHFDAVLRAHPELIGGYVPVVVTGGSGATSFRVLDPTAPNVQPS